MKNNVNVIFQDRTDAAKKLAKNLEWMKKDDPLILAIPRGGVVIGDVISILLDAKLDVIISKKVGAPHNIELALGAVLPDGSYFPNEAITKALNISQNYIKSQVKIKAQEITNSLIKFRGSSKYDLENKAVVLVDDGIATGATMFAAALWIRKHNPKKLIAAIPVGPKETIDKLSVVFDRIEVLYSVPDFNSVSEFYHIFDQINDDEVKKIMKKHNYRLN